MKKKLLCLFLSLSLAGIFSGCGDDLFKIQGKVYDNPSATDENSVTTNENGYQTYSKKISIDKKPEITNISVAAECSGNIKDECYIGANYPANAIVEQTVGIIGSPVEISANDTVKNITLTLTYNEDYLRGVPERNIFPMYVDYYNSIWQIIEDFELDTDKNTVSFPAKNEADYLLLDIYQYGTAMGMEVSKYAYENDITLYKSDWERERDTGDIMNLADKKWAVGNAPTFRVSTPQQLASVVYYVNAVNEQPIEVYLEKDLDLSQYDWKPMGWNTTYGANLIFHGQNHTINGLNINCHDIQDVGFTGYTRNIIMDNANFTNVNITGWRYVGGFSGECYGAKKFTNVSLSGTIYGDDENTGGFIGSGGSGICTDCTLDVTVNDKPCRYFSYADKFAVENIDETAFTLSVNEKNRVQRTKNEKYNHVNWVICDGDKPLLKRAAETETEIKDSVWEYLKAEKGKTYTIYMESYKNNPDGTSGYTRVSNILQYIYN